MPLKYVTEEVEFKGTPLKLAPPIFIPEEQTEILVDLLLKHIERSSSKVCTVLEVGCGVGAISLSLLRSCNSVSDQGTKAIFFARSFIHRMMSKF